MRKIKFVKGEYYHIYNRGVDKRIIFQDKNDAIRFIQSMKEFNSVEVFGGIQLGLTKKENRSLASKLVNFIAYRLNQNHYHFILQPLADDGIQKFMHRLSTGHTKFFNEKYNRSGSLFQGTYKAVHIETNEQLIHCSVYVNLNDQVHEGLNEPWLSDPQFSSFSEYQEIRKDGICDTSVIIDQYKNREEYSNHALSVLVDIQKRKEHEKALRKMIIET